MRLFLSSLICVFFAASIARADLKWDKLVQTFERAPEDAALEAHFTFRNVGQTPVTIKSLRPSCGCTTAKLEKKTYAPVEEGEVTARFVFGSRRGLHRLTVSVTTDERSSEPVLLDLRVNIHEAVTISPALVYWRRGEAATAKEVHVTAESTQPMHVKSVTSSNPRVAAALATVKPGGQYAVSVTPVDTAQKESAEISVVTEFPGDSPRTYTIHARVK